MGSAHYINVTLSRMREAKVGESEDCGRRECQKKERKHSQKLEPSACALLIPSTWRHNYFCLYFIRRISSICKGPNGDQFDVISFSGCDCGNFRLSYQSTFSQLEPKHLTQMIQLRQRRHHCALTFFFLAVMTHDISHGPPSTITTHANE